MGFDDTIFTVVVALMLIPIPFVVGGGGGEGSSAAFVAAAAAAAAAGGTGREATAGAGGAASEETAADDFASCRSSFTLSAHSRAVRPLPTTSAIAFHRSLLGSSFGTEVYAPSKRLCSCCDQGMLFTVTALRCYASAGIAYRERESPFATTDDSPCVADRHSGAFPERNSRAKDSKQQKSFHSPPP